MMRLRGWLLVLPLVLAACECKPQMFDASHYAGDAKIRVACVGDSITAGSGLADPTTQAYPALLGQMLGERFDVHNFGQSGHTLMKTGDRPYWDKLPRVDQFEPDVVIIMLGSNDSKPHNWEHRAEFGNDLAAMVEHFQNLPSKPLVLLAYPPAVTQSAYGISDEHVKAEQPAYQAVAREKCVQVIDAYTPFVGQFLLMRDGVHPNVEGAKVLAQTIHDGLIPPAPAPSK